MDEYLEFVSDLKFYINCELVHNKKETEKYNFPVGTLLAKDEEHSELNLYFNHYKSFEAAKEKWNERKNRILWDKIYVIYDFNDRDCNIELIHKFEDLSLKNKIVIVHSDIPDLKCAYKMKCIGKDDPIVKEFEYDSITGKRYFEEWDYISFLSR